MTVSAGRKTVAGISRSRNPGRSWWGILFYQVCWTALWLVFTSVYRLRVRGAANIPSDGPLLVVANHQSLIDPPCIGMAFKGRQLNFIARDGLFKNPVFAALIRGLNAVPIKENGSDTAAIRTALEQLGMGRALLIFPEGTRSPDGEIHEFKRGFWLLMSRAKCPVLPVAIEGAYRAFPRGRAWPRVWAQRLTVTVGKPISCDELLAMGPERGLPHLREQVHALRGAGPVESGDEVPRGA